MKIIIAPAKKMRAAVDYMEAKTTPIFIQESEQLGHYMKTLDIPALKKILGCSEAIAMQAYQMYQKMNLQESFTPALLAFDGIQYTYMVLA